MNNFNAQDNVFCRRISDGKYYRGAIFWRWTRYWRFAALLPVDFWQSYIIGIKFNEQVEFIGLNDLEKEL